MAPVIASEAKQSISRLGGKIDRLVASLLAMTRGQRQQLTPPHSPSSSSGSRAKRGVSKDAIGASWFETALARLLTMRIEPPYSTISATALPPATVAALPPTL